MCSRSEATRAGRRACPRRPVRRSGRRCGPGDVVNARSGGKDASETGVRCHVIVVRLPAGMVRLPFREVPVEGMHGRVVPLAPCTGSSDEPAVALAHRGLVVVGRPERFAGPATPTEAAEKEQQEQGDSGEAADDDAGDGARRQAVG